MKTRASRLKPCRHNQHSKATISFDICGPRNESILYCWICGSIKRDRKRWQLTTREEKIRTPKPRARKKSSK